MGRLTFWFLVGLTLLAVSTHHGVYASSDGPTESECRPYIEKALNELKTGEEKEELTPSPDTTAGSEREEELMQGDQPDVDSKKRSPKTVDTDGDGIPNEEDDDIDGDVIPNEEDEDLDGDGILNIHDPDLDGDGVQNVHDHDIDGDGVPNVNDNDLDGDGIPNDQDDDIDGDGIPNSEDDDIDGDGVLNDQDDDIDGDGILNVDDNDMDGDGVPNEKDDDIDGDGVMNSDDNDIDGDGIPNDQDEDIDGDGVLNVDDSDMDGDGIVNEDDGDMDGDGLANENDGDMDGDGVANEDDEDMDGDGVTNEDDEDLDGDGVPNHQDDDIDGDGVPNHRDEDIDGDGVPNVDDEDIDGDGVDNKQDHDLDGDGVPNYEDNDLDGDGVPNVHDEDIDGDGVDNRKDQDIDGDGVPNESDQDEDGDGMPNEEEPESLDIDGDGIPNDEDNDIDGDVVPNELDEDMDGDGIPNTHDRDIDGDGVPNMHDEDGHEPSAIQPGAVPIESEEAPVENAEEELVEEEAIDKPTEEVVEEEVIKRSRRSVETHPDMDGDGIPDHEDEDVDGDGVPNHMDDDIDGDGVPNHMDEDIDGDGVLNEHDEDRDGDGLPNAQDDSDGEADDKKHVKEVEAEEEEATEAETEEEEKEEKEGEEEEGEEEEEEEEEKGEGEEEEEDIKPEDELLWEGEIPEHLRSRDHITELLQLGEDSLARENAFDSVAAVILRDIKRIYENAIKPLETLYKYRDLSNRHFGDPEIFSKPLVLFMGPWSGGKSTIINYLTDNEYTTHSLRSGAEPSPAYFNILMWGNDTEILEGTQLAADYTFSGLQKFGQGLEDRLRGLKLPNKLLEKVNIVEIPGILEVRKQVARLFPFNDACQWFIDRADIIFLVYDPTKLDVGPETEAILDQLKGREYQTRIILNKADIVKPEELLRVQSALIWNISPLMSSAQPPLIYTTSLWSHPYQEGSPARLLLAQERAFLRDLRTAVDRRIENKIASARRFAVRVRNHAKMVDCYLNTYFNHKTLFSNKKRVADNIIENPQNYHIYEGLSTLTNISRYDLPDPEVYRDFFRLNPLYEFKKLSETCSYFRGCPLNKLDVAIAYDLPDLAGKYKKMAEAALAKAESSAGKHKISKS